MNDKFYFCLLHVVLFGDYTVLLFCSVWMLLFLFSDYWYSVPVWIERLLLKIQLCDTTTVKYFKGKAGLDEAIFRTT